MAEILLRTHWWFGPGQAAEITWPVHDPPVAWNSWGFRGGGLPYAESLRGAPVGPDIRFGRSDLPTLQAYPAALEGSK